MQEFVKGVWYEVDALFLIWNNGWNNGNKSRKNKSLINVIILIQ